MQAVPGADSPEGSEPGLLFRRIQLEDLIGIIPQWRGCSLVEPD